jgi:SPP1 gp7 family putative phage head morphogenesis protein
MNSKEYWRKREEEALTKYKKSEAEYDKEIERIYADMLDNCNAQINAFYGKYADKEGITLAEAKKRVKTADIKEFERKAAKYVRDASLDRKANGGKTNKQGYYFSPKAEEEMRLYNTMMKINRLEMLKANIGVELIKGHDELDKFMGDILKGRTEEELKRQAGILGKTIRNNAQLAHTIPNASFHNATFSDRIWQYQDLMREDLSKILSSGLIQGKNPRAIAKDLKKYWYGPDPKTKGGAVYCMERLMRTEMARVQTEAQKQSFEKNGFSEYEFIANSDCCGICKALDGKHFKVSKMMPGENAAPIHPHCRCSVAAYEDSKEYEEWLSFLEKGGTTAEWEQLKQIK